MSPLVMFVYTTSVTVGRAWNDLANDGPDRLRLPDPVSPEMNG